MIRKDYHNDLIKAKDFTLHPTGFNRNGAGSNAQYTYDDYGNLIADPYKGIEAITYNHLNLPVKVSFQAGETIAYTYLADGSKVKKKTHDGQSNTTTTEYREGFQYRNNLLEFFPYGAGAEGYVKASTGQLNVFYNYVYTYTDHLGNIRLKYITHPQTGETTILEEDHYYPYGLSHATYASHHLTIGLEEPGADITLIEVTPDVSDPHKYKFGGMEYQDEFDINLYDFGARNYDPAIVRTLTPDPLGEAFYHLSPYSFLNNNPMSNIDPTGALTLTGQAAKDWFQGLKDDIESKPRKRKENEDEDDVANPNNPIELEEIVINGKKRKGLQASGINFQDRHAGSMSEWQKMTEGKFSTNHDLADLQWEVSYGDAHRNYFQAQLNVLIAEIHNGQLDFLRGSYNLTADLMQNTGDVTMTVGYGLTLTGVGASIGIPMMTAGKTMSGIGGGMNAASSFVNGNNTSGFIYLGSTVIGGQSSRLINRNSNIVGLSKPLLEYNIRLKLSGGKRLIND